MVHSIYLSFFSRDLYLDVARRWKGLCLLYLLALLSLYCIPLVLYYVEMIGRDLEEKAPHIIHQIPEVTISGGKAKVGVTEPYYVYSNEGKSVFMIIDTTGSTRSLEGTGSKILLTQSQVMMRISPDAVHTMDLIHIEDMTVDKRSLYGWMESFREIIPFVLYPLFLIFIFCYRFFYASALSVVGLAVNRLLNTGLPLRAVIRVSVVAMTPSIVIETVTTLFRIQVMGWWFAGIGLSVGYLIFAIRANKDAQTHSPHGERNV